LQVFNIQQSTSVSSSLKYHNNGAPQEIPAADIDRATKKEEKNIFVDHFEISIDSKFDRIINKFVNILDERISAMENRFVRNVGTSSSSCDPGITTSDVSNYGSSFQRSSPVNNEENDEGNLKSGSP
jgi:hypothetical protein